jgi:hypothetical protein
MPGSSKTSAACERSDLETIRSRRRIKKVGKQFNRRCSSVARRQPYGDALRHTPL